MNLRSHLSQHINENRKLYRILVLIFGAAWIYLTASPEGLQSPDKLVTPQKGFLAPDFTLITAENHQFTLSDLKGKPVLINLWASWCVPCRTEMPAIQKVYEDYKNEGFIVLAVNTTNQDSRTAAINFADEHGLTFPILFDVDGRVSKSYRLRALPSSFFVDNQGVIQEVIIGGPMAEALLRTRVEHLLEETQ